jgi:phosphoribosylaminoimidazolecarboxamide formyltransferase/IMP cyclohydrolase
VYFEVVIAPGFSAEAVDILGKRKQLRLLEMPADSFGEQAPSPLDLRAIRGGLLLQDADDLEDDPAKWTVASTKQPSADEWEDLVFAWDVARSVKSNAIVLARNKALLGTGSGQPNRVESVHIAVKRAGERAAGSVLAGDAFFPFPDGVEAAIAAGVTAIVQPGGSVRDNLVLEAVEKAGISMVFTGTRHFRH